jgi:cyclin A
MDRKSTKNDSEEAIVFNSSGTTLCRAESYSSQIMETHEQHFVTPPVKPSRSKIDAISREKAIQEEDMEDATRYVYNYMSEPIMPPPEVFNLENHLLNDGQMDAHYERCIHIAKRDAEGAHVMDTRYIYSPNKRALQQYLTVEMRTILVDWLIDLADTHRISTQCIYLTVHLLDFIVSKKIFRKTQFQLVGCACLLLASKMEEICAISAEYLVKYSDHCFDLDLLMQMEQQIAIKVDFNMNLPTRLYFLQRLIIAAKLNGPESAFAMYLCELTLLDFSLAGDPMSKVAAAVIHVTLQLFRPLDSLIWNSTLQYYSMYTEKQIMKCVVSVFRLHSTLAESNYKAAYKRYDKKEHYFTSSIIVARRIDEVRFDCEHDEASIHSSESYCSMSLDSFQ